MNALAAPPPFPTNPTTGEVYCGFVWNGSSWVCQSGGPLLIIQAFTASGTYFPSPGLSFALGEVQGGGGGGGGALGYATASVPGWIMGGGGGGSGMYVRKAVSAALVRGGIPIAIGAGGLAGGPAVNGGQGGTTTFGAIAIAPGGGGGQYGNVSAAPPQWGAGGTRGGGPDQPVGDIINEGTGGVAGESNWWVVGGSSGPALGGVGGASWFGGTGTSIPTILGQANDGRIGVQGGGGAGGASGGSGFPAQGGVGGDGMVVVTEYCLQAVGPGPGGCGCGGQGQGMARVAIDAGWAGQPYGLDGPRGGYNDD